MKIEHSGESYRSGGGEVTSLNGYDYCLFRQDFNGCEFVYFNLDEEDELYDGINDGEFAIHPNYSILYCKNEEMLEKMETALDCFSVVFK